MTLRTAPTSKQTSVFRKIVEVTPLPGYKLDLAYADGSHSVVDFLPRIKRGGVFAPLRDFTFFSQASIGEDGRTIEWPGEVDFCADSLWLDGNT